MTVFLLTDVEGSTRLWQNHGDAMPSALKRHDDLIARTVEAHGGDVWKHTGDGAFCAFERGDAIACALALQNAIAAEDWPFQEGLRVRISIHVGEAQRRDGGYFGADVNYAVRVCDAGWGGQTLASSAAVEALSLPPGAAVVSLGIHLLKDLLEPQELFQVTSAGAAREFPPLRTLSGGRHNLPPQSTPFVGRESELASITALLAAPACRLLTLLGPGGIGKTRLAIQAGAEVAETFPGGVWFIPLVTVTAGEDLAESVAQALHFSFGGKGDTEAQLLNYLSDKTLLLIFDNFEHLTASSVFAGRVLEAAPHVKVLATSRERLNLRMEKALEVAGMRCPSGGDGVDAESYGAVRLFIQSAKRADASFEPTREDLPAVIRACELVGGTPLAIELAAAWTRVMPPAEIVERLSKNLDLLRSAPSDVPERHRGFAAVFEYSYSLLNEEERSALAGLGVFPGGFERGAAAAVAGASLNTLASLTDKSLIRRTQGGRFELHPLLRQYAEEKLAAGTEAAVTTERFARFYIDYLTARKADLAGGRQKEALREVTAELGNIRTAWAAAVTAEDAAQVAAAADALFSYYRTRGLVDEGARAFRHAAAAFPRRAGAPEPYLLARAKTLTRAANCLASLGHHAEASEAVREAVGIAKKLGHRREIAAALSSAASLAFNAGAHERSRRLFEAALKLNEADDNAAAVAGNLFSLGTIAAVAGDYARARDLFYATLERSRALGDLNRIANVSNNLGSVEGWNRNFDAARALFTECLAAARELGNLRLVTTALHNLVLVYNHDGDYGASRRALEEALAITRDLNDPLAVSGFLAQLAALANRTGEYDRAMSLCNEGIKESRLADRPGKDATLFAARAAAELGLGDVHSARGTIALALEEALAGRKAETITDVLITAAIILSRSNRVIIAGRVLGAVLAHAPDATVEDNALAVISDLEKEHGRAVADAVESGRGHHWKDVANDVRNALSAA